MYKFVDFCSSRRPFQFAPQRGFSLIETMVMVVLLGLSLVLAIPSYTDMIEKRQVTNGAEQLVAFVNTAQGLAMKTNEVVTVSYSRTDGDTWCIGAVSGDTACDCSVTNSEASDYCEVDTIHMVLNNTHTGNTDLLHDITGDGAYAFDPVRGLFTDLDDSLVMELRSDSDSFQLNLLVNNTGRVLLCSADSDHSIPGYSVCPVAETGDTSEPGDPIDPGEEPPIEVEPRPSPGFGIGIIR